MKNNDHKQKVVPFERPASYWANRARKHDTPEDRPDAARMLRKALKESSDPAIALDLARVCIDMRCYSAAIRWLLWAGGKGTLTADVCYQIGRCALGMADEDMAQAALEACLRKEPDGRYADDAQALLESYPWTMNEWKPRGARSRLLCAHALMLREEGEMAAANQMARYAWEKGHSGRVAMLRASLSSSTKYAVQMFAYAVRQFPTELRPRLLLARACADDGQKTAAKINLLLARSLCRNLGDLEIFCAVAWELGQYNTALQLINHALVRYPASADYLRLKYVTLTKMGITGAAKRTLQTMLEADPDDESALLYRQHPRMRDYNAPHSMTFPALEMMLKLIPDQHKPGPLNRTLHLMVMMLDGSVTTQQVYFYLPPLWHRLSPDERKACDDRRKSHYPLAIALYLLLCAGQQAEADQMLCVMSGKKRVLRTLKHFARLMED